MIKSLNSLVLCDSCLIKLNGWLLICTFTKSYGFFSSGLGDPCERENFYTRRVRIAKGEKRVLRETRLIVFFLGRSLLLLHGEVYA